MMMGGPCSHHWSSSSCNRLLFPTAVTALLLPIPSSSPLLRRLRRSRGRPPRLRLILCSASSSYNGWGELPEVSSSFSGWGELPDVSFSSSSSSSSFSFPFLLDSKEKKNGLLLLLLLLVIPASAVTLSRLPRLPLLAAAFTAGFAARHLSSSPQHSALTLVLADLDAQVRALRDAASSSNSQPMLHALDRLRDAVLHATRLAHHDDTTPALAPLGDLADSMAAWARDTMRDLLSSTRNKPDLHSKATHSSSPIPQDAPAPATEEHMLPFHRDAPETATSRRTSTLEVERLLLKHRRRQSMGMGSSSLLEKSTLEIRDRSYRLNIHSQRHDVSEAQEHSQVDHRLDPLYDDAAATVTEDQFNHKVKEAAEILKKARECMMATADEETADALLYKSAKLLSAAVALRPTSLVAVGQLGNTYLLHGELKLKISRELRTLLANTTNRREPRKVVDSTRILLSRENISAALVDVCEECESLLVEAGRSYRTALSIDSGDVKALYNWGLALIFRAQLLADIGPEAAVDADRVYLAAIDKFDAMLSKSNTYAPEALYRWGTALQQRSHLRPRNNREKIRLLEQAKSLFEDVLYVEADNKMVREALSSCISELNYHGRWI